MFIDAHGAGGVTGLNPISPLRYAGGKSKFLRQILSCMHSTHLADLRTGSRRFVEPFIGGGSVFFALQAKYASISDIDPLLIYLYRGLQANPVGVWDYYMKFPADRAGFMAARASLRTEDLEKNPIKTAGKILFLNRTCFKGLWRKNNAGQLNTGFGDDHRFQILKSDLLCCGHALEHTKIENVDFAVALRSCKAGDYIFVDPPYRKGSIATATGSYHRKFSFEEHERLANWIREWCLFLSCLAYCNNFVSPGNGE